MLHARAFGAGRRAPSTLVRAATGVFDRLRDGWESHAAHRRIGTVLVVAFLGSIAAIELNRLGLVPAPLSHGMTTNHLGAIYVAFTLLLFVEVVGLVFALARSVADAVGKQFELFSLILLRKAFMELSAFGEPIRWEDTAGAVPVITADVGGALLVFVVLGFYYRVQRHVPISADVDDQASFVAAKKLLALGLLATFVVLVANGVVDTVLTGSNHSIFENFYTVLIFTDILVVLISLRYSAAFAVVFRNSGFAAATVLLRLALTAPVYVNALLGLGAAVFALSLSLAYNTFAPVIGASERDTRLTDV